MFAARTAAQAIGLLFLRPRRSGGLAFPYQLLGRRHAHDTAEPALVPILVAVGCGGEFADHASIVQTMLAAVAGKAKSHGA